jgi:hypothetical protein
MLDVKNPKSLAQVWICSRQCMAMLEALMLELLKYDKVEDLQAQVVDMVLYLFLSIGIPYYQEGYNISFKTNIKSAH